MNENIIVPHPLHHLLADGNRGRGRPDSNNRKNSDKGVFFVFFCNYIFLRFKRVETFIRGGGGVGVQLFIIFIETYITCDFSGGGGGPDHLSLSGFAHG